MKKQFSYICPREIREFYDSSFTFPFPHLTEWDLEEELSEYKALWWPNKLYVRYFTDQKIVAKAKWLGVLTCMEVDGMINNCSPQDIMRKIERRSYALSFMKSRYSNPLFRLLEEIKEYACRAMDAYAKSLLKQSLKLSEEVTKDKVKSNKIPFFANQGLILSAPPKKWLETDKMGCNEVHVVKITNKRI